MTKDIKASAGSVALAGCRPEALVLGWQPFETAPKDGKPLLLWLEDEGFWVQAVWREVRARTRSHWWNEAWGCGMEAHNITHWMRPSAPTPPVGSSGYFGTAMKSE